MKLEAKFWGVPLIGWIVGGVFVWLLCRSLRPSPTRRNDVDEVLDAFGVSDTPGSPALGKVTQ
jgi:hypothetical protein